MNSLACAIERAYVPVGDAPAPVIRWKPWGSRNVRFPGERRVVVLRLMFWFVLSVPTMAFYPRYYPMPASVNTGSSVANDVRDCVATGRSEVYCESIFVPTGIPIGMSVKEYRQWIKRKK